MTALDFFTTSDFREAYQPMNASRHAKDLKIETLRGLALILMVIGHIIGSSPEVGMRVAEDSFLRYLYDSLAPIRMPLFTAISGFVYALRPVTPASRVRPFLWGKVIRIGIPLVVVSALFFLSRLLIPDTSMTPKLENFFVRFIYGYAHFWFLQAILVIFLVIAVLDKCNVTTGFAPALGILAGALLIPPWLPRPPGVFSLDQALGLFPFFMLGLCLCRFPAALGSRRNTLPIAAVAALLLATYQAQLLGLLDLAPGRLGILGVALGLSAIHTLIALRFYFAPLRFLGQYAYEVYLFHVFGTAGARILLSRLDIHAPLPVFAFGLAAGLLLPITLKRIAQQNAVCDLLLFGSKRASLLPAQRQPLREGS